MKGTLILFCLLVPGLTAAQTSKPVRHRLRLDAWPPRSRLSVTLPDGKVRRGWGRMTLYLKGGGKVTVTATKRKHRSRTETLDVTGDTRHTLCLDPDDQLVSCQRIIPCRTKPKGVVLSPDGRQVWVAILWGPTTLQVFDTKTGEKLHQLSLKKHGGTELELNADRSKVYLSQMSTAEVHEFDFKTRKLLRTFETKGTWTKVIKLSADEKTLFASNWVSRDISVIDLQSGMLRHRIRTVRKPRGMYPTPDGRFLYVAGFKEGQLAKIDLQTRKQKILYDKGISLRHIVADEKKKVLYISDLGLDRIDKVDLKTDKVSRWVKANQTPNTIALSPDRKILFVSHRGARGDVKYTEPGPEWGSVLLFDTETGKILDAIVGGNQPTALAISDDGKTIVFSDFLDNRLRVYSVPPYEELKKGNGGRAKSHRRDLKKKDWNPDK
jgi:DNA-binding beta-propeller fold protein YncE